jgi:formiminoglutamase
MCSKADGPRGKDTDFRLKKSNMKQPVVIYSRGTVQSEIAFRPGEHKIGERMHYLEPGETMKDLKKYAEKNIHYALLGIPESIGVTANFGRCCTNDSWPAFLRFFLNFQSNRFFSGENILCLGHVDTQELNQAADSLDPAHPNFIARMRDLCSRLDDMVYPTIEAIIAAGIFPIIIGGGHNNAYPILKGTARALGAAHGINCINCDAHADMRALEGRHSGNGFSYAFKEGYLFRYLVFGLQEGYNSEAVFETFDRHEHISYIPFDPKRRLSIALKTAVSCFKDSELPVGVELDLDSIKNMPSSSVTPSGFSVEEARIFISEIASEINTAYLHLAEGAPTVNTYEETKVGKTLAYLVADFIKSRDPKSLLSLQHSRKTLTNI